MKIEFILARPMCGTVGRKAMTQLTSNKKRQSWILRKCVGAPLQDAGLEVWNRLFLGIADPDPRLHTVPKEHGKKRYIHIYSIGVA